MESASIPARPPRARGDVLRENISKWGLIVLLLALPVYFGIKDLGEEGDLSRLGNNLKDGLSNGAIWASIAIGYTLVYGIIELINFAHGDLFMIGSFIAFGMLGVIGLTTETAGIALFGGLLIVLLVAMIGAGTLNTMIERVGLPATAQRAQAGAAHHRRRLLVHPAERRPALARRLAQQRAGPDQLAGHLRHRSSASASTTATCSPPS